MSPCAPPFDAFSCSLAPVHAACYAQQAAFAACPRQVSASYKSSIGAAFDAAASSGGAAHALVALEQLVLEYVRSLMCKYNTLRDKRTQQAATCDRDSKHLLLQQELALLHEIIDMQHDMQELQRLYPRNQQVVDSSQAIAGALVLLL